MQNQPGLFVDSRVALGYIITDKVVYDPRYLRLNNRCYRIWAGPI